MVFDKKPENFNMKFEVVTCIIEFEGKILMLKRQKNKEQPNRYGTPGGKVEKNETLFDAILREIEEETSIKLQDEKVKFYKTTFIDYGEYQYSYNVFHTKLKKEANVKINPAEHQEFVWKTPRQALELDLIKDEDINLENYFNITKENSFCR